jgi:hypothetical protein
MDVAPKAEALDGIDDIDFMRNLRRLQELRTFLIQEAVTIPNSMVFGPLNLLKYTESGRAPSLSEWDQLERLTTQLFNLLTPPLRRKFVTASIPQWMATTTVALGVTAIAALFAAALSLNIGLIAPNYSSLNTLPFYIIWLVSLGAIGSIAFIGMNALSVQDDVTFDPSNRRLMVLRIVLGALFGLVLTLPFGFADFYGFCSSLAYGGAARTPDGIPRQAVLLLLPFVLGFGTSLVIMVLNRLVGSIEAFFGKPADPNRAGALPQPATVKPHLMEQGG